MIRRALVPFLTAVLVAGTAVAPSPATAAVQERGTVVYVADGDTIDVDVDGVGKRRVRIVGLQAMELTEYHSDLDAIRGECHAVEATRRLHDLLHGKRVVLRSLHKSSTSGSRLYRSVEYWEKGAFHDVGRVIIAEGLALPNSNGTEYARNKTYQTLAQKAAKAGKGMFRRNACGNGPYAYDAVKVWVKYDAPGDDAKNPNGEYIKVKNTTSSTIRLDGWWVRDNYIRRYTFPAGTKLGPGKSLYVHPGKGRNTSTHHYWGLDKPIFENPGGSPKHMGDGGYLFDPQGDLRGWHMYPNRL